MVLILIYGPPAVGKLTVAKELSKITGYKILHNHTSLDMLLPIFDDMGTLLQLSTILRKRILKEALKRKLDIIMTLCYACPNDDKNIKDLIMIGNKYKTKVHFVQLLSPLDIIHRRVTGSSRKRYGKLKSIRELDSAMEGYELFTKIPFVRSLSIENSRLSPIRTARRIKKSLRL